MTYRREIDGLRALAVLPVILFHAGFKTFSGGFIGVDVFFVISGYLITTIILTELELEKFSIIDFYERRARRILPALFVVMFASLITGFFWQMPDEFKNLGQSLVATSLFSNNILLGLTTGYWDLASEFKPLLHTWSLGVEEQYYVIVPILLIISAKFGRCGIATLLWGIVLSSFFLANQFVNVSPKWAFFMFPTRAWEIGAGALVAFYLRRQPFIAQNNRFSNFLSFGGLLLILLSIFTFQKDVVSLSWPLLVPTLGAVLIIIFCRPKSLVFRILGSKIFVFCGLLSYSFYLWHQPVFAYLRVYSVDVPSAFDFFYLIPFIFLLSFLTWKYVETPFRNKAIFGRKFIFNFSLCLSFFFVAAGLYLNNSYGISDRVFSDGISMGDMDKRIYNEKVFFYKKDHFENKNLTNILIVGDSFARDFVNITLENFDVSRAEIVYRDDLSNCIETPFVEPKYRLYNDADVIIFANAGFQADCCLKNIVYAESRGKKIYYIGTKDFGYNLNWIIRLDKNRKRNQYNAVTQKVLHTEEVMAKFIPSGNFISLLAPNLLEGKIPITDDVGRMLTTDRSHLTKFGAMFFGKNAVVGSPYADSFK